MIKLVLFLIGRIIGLLYPQSFHLKILSAYDIIYTGYVCRYFKIFGDNSKIANPARIIGGKFIVVGNNVYFSEHSYLSAFNIAGNVEIQIGDNSMFGPYNHITCCSQIKIGSNVRTGSYVLISDNSHGNPSDNKAKLLHPNNRPLYSKGPILIGDNVWIGDKVAILGGVTIGKGAIIGANSVITHDVPEYSIAVGCPAKIIGLKAIS